MSNYRIYRFLAGGHWVLKNGKWRQVNAGVFRTYINRRTLYGVSDFEDWSGERYGGMRASFLVIFAAGIAACIFAYAAGFPV